MGRGGVVAAAPPLPRCLFSIRGRFKGGGKGGGGVWLSEGGDNQYMTWRE